MDLIKIYNGFTNDLLLMYYGLAMDLLWID